MRNLKNILYHFAAILFFLLFILLLEIPSVACFSCFDVSPRCYRTEQVFNPGKKAMRYCYFKLKYPIAGNKKTDNNEWLYKFFSFHYTREIETLFFSMQEKSQFIPRIFFCPQYLHSSYSDKEIDNLVSVI